MDKRFRYMTRQNISYYKNRIKYGISKLTHTISDNMILFESYGGKKYNDSVRAIYEELLRDERYRSFYFVWAFRILPSIFSFWKIITRFLSAKEVGNTAATMQPPDSGLTM